MSHPKVITPTHLGSELSWNEAKPHIIARLMAKIVKQDNGCWIWTGSKMTLGYGELTVQGRRWRVHRLAYTLWHGPVPEGMEVCHRCDTIACLAPDHLFAASHRENLKDAAAKGRLQGQWKEPFREWHSARLIECGYPADIIKELTDAREEWLRRARKGDRGFYNPAPPRPAYQRRTNRRGWNSGAPHSD